MRPSKTATRAIPTPVRRRDPAGEGSAPELLVWTRAPLESSLTQQAKTPARLTAGRRNRQEGAATRRGRREAHARDAGQAGIPRDAGDARSLPHRPRRDSRKGVTGGHGELQVPPRNPALLLQAMRRQGNLPARQREAPMPTVWRQLILPMRQAQIHMSHTL